MERKTALTDRIASIIIYVVFSVGVVGHLIPATYPLMLRITPYVLLIMGHLLILRFAAGKNVKVLLWIIIVFLFTFMLEVIGVKTGYIFGNYSYGNTLGAKFLDVPIIIGFNWTFIILGAISISQKVSSNKYIVIISAAIMALLFDMVLEPVAVKLNYWSWAGGIIPLKNYISWFLIAALSTFLFYKMKLKVSFLPGIYFVVQLVFFLILRIILIGG